MITRQQALELLESDDLIAAGMEANALRTKLNPEDIVSYLLSASAIAADSSVAHISFQAGDSAVQHLARLEEVRQIQAESNAFLACVPSYNGTAAEYLKLMAVSRIYLDNIAHIQASPVTGLKICQIALRFGANDIGAQENGSLRATEEEIRRLIRDAGYTPKKRDALFRFYSLS